MSKRLKKKRKGRRRGKGHRLRCGYCGTRPKLVTSKEFYGRDYGTNVYLCKNCNAYVTTHRFSTKPMGTLANEELRKLRIKCHNYFDPFWRMGCVTRDEAYEWLSIVMDLPPEKAHIGMFDEEQCRKLLDILQKGVKALEERGVEIKNK